MNGNEQKIIIEQTVIEVPDNFYTTVMHIIDVIGWLPTTMILTLSAILVYQAYIAVKSYKKGRKK